MPGPPDVLPGGACSLAPAREALLSDCREGLSPREGGVKPVQGQKQQLWGSPLCDSGAADVIATGPHY